jgi:hypothetical protein
MLCPQYVFEYCHRLDDISMKPSLQFAISVIIAFLLTAAGKTVFGAQNLANGENWINSDKGSYFAP